MKKSIIKGVFALAIFSSALVACKKINPTEGVEQIVDATFSNATVSFQFVDAKTGMQLDLTGAEDIQLDVVGKNATDIVTNLATTAHAADYGISAMALKDGVTPSTSNPIEFSVSATATGYLPASKSVVILQEGHQHFVVKMVKIIDTPEGVSATQDVIASVPSSGIIAADFTLSPSAVAATGTTASVEIPQGTVLKDKNNALVGGNVTATLAYFNPNDSEFSSSFPSQLYHSKLSTGEHVSFSPLGMVAMEMNSSTGKEIKNFGSPIAMMMQIPDGATNDDGSLVQAGDSFGVFSYDEDKAEWKLESTTVAVLNATSGKLEVSFNMTHLSAWQFGQAETSYDAWNSYKDLTMTSSCGDALSALTDVQLDIYSNGRKVSSEVAYLNFNSPVKVHSCINPASEAHIYRYYRKSNPTDYVEFNSLSGNTTINFPSSWCPPTNQTFKILLETNCPNSTRKVKPQCLIMAVEEGKFFQGNAWKFLGQMNVGELSTSTAVLEKGKKYTLITIYNDKLVALTGSLNPFTLGSVTIDGNDIDLSRPLTSTECTYLKKITG